MPIDLRSCWPSAVGVFSINDEVSDIVVEVSLDVGTEIRCPLEEGFEAQLSE